MADHYKIRMKEMQVKDYVKMTCDLCKRETKKHDWGEGIFDVDEIEIKRYKGTSYPDGGCGTEIKVDICPDCFENKLVPWLKSQNCAITEKHWSC